MGEVVLPTDPTQSIIGNYALGCYSVALWWLKREFEINNDSYGKKRQVEFGLNGPNEEWINDDCGLNEATPMNLWEGHEWRALPKHVDEVLTR